MTTAVITVEELEVHLGKPSKCEVTFNGRRCLNDAAVRIRWTTCLCERVRTAFLCKPCLELIPAIGYSCASCYFANFEWVTL